MRAVQIALFVLCIQIGMAFVIEGGFFDRKSIYYESSLTNLQLSNNISALNTLEQDQMNIDIFTKVKDAFTWKWIITFFKPTYDNDTDVKNFADHIQLLFIGINAIVIGAAAIELFQKSGSGVL